MDFGEDGTLRIYEDSNTWLTADHHWGHANIITYTYRPFTTIKRMNEVLIENWNSCIGKDDYVFHLGDFCYPKYIDPQLLLASLNGHIILVKGNHDKQKTTKYFMGRAYDKLPVDIVAKGGKTYRCILNHRPVHPAGEPDPHHDHDCTIDPKAYDFILCGHVHEKWLWRGNCFNVGVDRHNFYPLHINEIIKAFGGRAKWSHIPNCL